ncbi:hypothetical protein HOY80DRAFT_1005280 [Tuber brumale]|nr:hypothetical protein HOY80DRAFT_1005280 [Tuber brumale]
MSNVANRVRDAIAGQQDGTTTDRTTGPHRSDMANRADPRVDSDRDHRGSPVGGTGLGGMGSTHTAGSTNYSPHDSNIANKVDPRVDSGGDGRGPHGASGTHGATGLGSTGARGLGATGPIGHGPRDSSMMSELDPRADSNRDDRGGIGYTGTHGTHGTTGIGSTGTHTSTVYDTSTNVGPDSDGRAGLGSTTQGAPGIGSTGTHTGTGYGTSTSHDPHGSNIGNKLDPRVDSDRDRRAAQATTYTGPAPGTVGPHKSDLMNKLDPRVDSDLDGSKTIGTGATRGTHH